VFFDFAITDARAAGANRFVLIVRREFAHMVEEHVRHMHGDDLDLALVCQDETDAPPRAKPWGTGHAILTAGSEIDRPFLVVNADDYYGTTSYRQVADALRVAGPDTAVLAGFQIGRTLPSHGSVSRGVCSVNGDRLTRIVETHGIERRDGTIISTDPPGELAEETPVSMNMWGFEPSIVGHLDRLWGRFLAASGHEEKSEFLLPSAVGQLMDEDALDVRVVVSPDDWIGVTNPDDLEPARATLATLRA
jgi:NDP-sugar pyrophosphorylase family protein